MIEQDKNFLDRQEYKEQRLDARKLDFKDMLIDELHFTQEEKNFEHIDSFKLWKIEYRKFIRVKFVEHIIEVELYEVDELVNNFYFNIYKGSPRDFNNCKNIIRSLVLF